MKPSIRTDLELAINVSETIGRAYYEGVEYSKVLPSHSLVRYRDILEEVCEIVAKTEGVVLKKASIDTYIRTLLDAGAITFSFKDRLHKIKTLCNPGAHYSKGPGENLVKEDYRLRHENLENSATEVRELILWVLERVYSQLHGITEKLSYLRITIESQEWKDLLLSATVDENPEVLYKAAMLCVAETERRLVSNQYPIVSDEFAAQQEFLERLAATYFRASYKLKPNADASFRYARFVNMGKIDGDKQDEARALIKAAADSGHGEACELYGGILYDDDNDYEQALKYFLLSEENNEPRAYFCLWMYYTQGKACEPSYDKAFEYVKRGVEQNCRDCLFALGREYFEGLLIPKDIEKAKDLLQKSAELGNGQALMFKKVYVDIGIDNLMGEMQNTFLKALARIPVASKTVAVASPVAVDPYSLCSCNSGKKFRFCCMKKKEEPKQNKPLRFISL
jgi:tetratricopeptide (TPR) repeat protein